jgi:hypothetical protein
VGDVFLAYQELKIEIVEQAEETPMTDTATSIESALMDQAQIDLETGSGARSKLADKFSATIVDPVRPVRNDDNLAEESASRLADGQMRRRLSLADLLEEARRASAAQDATRRRDPLLGQTDHASATFEETRSRVPWCGVEYKAGAAAKDDDRGTIGSLIARITRGRDTSRKPRSELEFDVHAAWRQASALHRGLALGDRRVLAMIDAMAAFEPRSAADLTEGGRSRDPRVTELLTSLPDIHRRAA